MKTSIFSAAALALLLGMVAVAALSCGGSSRSSGQAIDDDASPDDDDDNDDASPDDDQSPDDDDDNDTFTCDITHPSSTVGLISCQPGAYDGYTLFAPTMTSTVYLIDMYGYLINTWPGKYLPGQVVYLLENGQLLRTGNTLNLNFASGGQGGVIMYQNWDGTVTWSYTLSTADVCLHHDVHRLPNGNLLAIGWEKKSPTEAVAAGRDPSNLAPDGLWSDFYMEITPVGTNGANVVWEWHAWDHLIQDFDATKANYGVVGAHPELIDVNYYGVAKEDDWMHTNSIDYNAAYDQILASVREFSEVWMLDHGTTTAEAAGHSGGARGRGGDLLYRWGNPDAYRQTTGRDFYFQHNGQWIADGLPGAGDVLAYNNGVGRPAGNYSTIDEFAPAVNADGSYPAPDPMYGPAGLVWTYVDPVPTEMYSVNMSGVQRLANGNTLICVGETGVFMEVTSAGALVWQYVNPATEIGIMKQGQVIPPGVGGDGNMSFRAYRYAPDYPGLAGQNLTPGACLVAPCK
jgi:hypothetical protein